MKIQQAEAFIKNSEQTFSDYRSLVRSLEGYVIECLDLEHKQNPVVKRLSELNKNEVRWVIKEYSQFSNEAIHMLLDARLRTHEWPKVAEEIDRNIDEEKGKETQGVPHLEIMRKGYQISLSFDVNFYEPAAATKKFIHEMRRIFRKKENAYLAGALLAFESVSIPEFYVLDSLLEKWEKENGILTRNEYTSDYVKGHKFFEVGHKEGLLQAIEPYIESSRAGNFAAGYLAVCVTISNWWNDLSESIPKK